MRQWKRIAAGCMVAALAAAVPNAALAGTPEFARTAQEWERLRDNVMEYDEIDDLIHEYNAAVKNNQLDINNKKNGKEVTSEEMAQALRDSAESIRSGMAGDGTDYAQELSARRLELEADNNTMDLEVYKMTYAQTEASLAMSAKNNLISYKEKLLQLPAQEKNRETLETVYQSVVAKASVGTATQIEVLNAQKNVQDADAEIAKTKAEIEKLKQNLCVMLVWKYDAEPEIRDIPATDLTRIDRIDLQADKEKALENNYTLNINKRKLSNSRTATMKEALELSIRNNQEKIGTDLSAKYQAVLQAKNAYNQALLDADLAARSMQAADLKMSINYISRVEYAQEQNNNLAKQTAARVADLELFKAMEAYDSAVNGLAVAE